VITIEGSEDRPLCVRVPADNGAVGVNQLKELLTWWSRLGSNQRPPACEAGALPLSYETGAKRRTTSKISTRGPRGRTRCVGRRISARATLRKICAGPLGSTIVVLRTGRRSRSLRADVAQLVAHHLAKVRVAGSNPVIRSRVTGGIKPPDGGVAEW
jgi:hypothetical protein